MSYDDGWLEIWDASFNTIMYEEEISGSSGYINWDGYGNCAGYYSEPLPAGTYYVCVEVEVGNGALCGPDPLCDHIAIFTVIGIDLQATDLYGTVTDTTEESTGAFIHYNLDNDNSSNNAVPSTKHPGADYYETTSAVTGEDDLMPLTMSLSPSLQDGWVYLSISTGCSAKIWKSDTKGSSNLVLDSGSKWWYLGDSGDRNEFNTLCSSLYVEGAGSTGGNISLTYLNPNSQEVTSDTVKYTFIAADCGDQPTTTGTQRLELDESSDFPNLQRCEYSIISPASGTYNCIAWSVNETGFWYNPDYIDRTYGNPPSGNGIFEDSDMNAFYSIKKSWSQITTGTNLEKANDAEAMYYSYGVSWDYVHDPVPSTGYHGARRKSCSCGAGKWIMYESKIGGLEKIEHVWNQLNGPLYGSPTIFYK
jgi:hypothetical protein